MRKPETALRRKIIQALEEKFPLGLFSKIHGNPYQEAGISDIICCVHGCFIGLEVKRPGQEATLIQKSWGNRVLKADGHWRVVTSPEEAIKEVKIAITPFLRHLSNLNNP